MSNPVTPIPEHLHTVTARLVIRDAGKAIAFYKAAFEAQELNEKFLGPNGEIIHAELRIGDSVIMVTEDSDPEAPAKSPQGGKTSVVLATYWKNVDSAWKRAVDAGAEIIYPLEDQFYGERGGRLRDPFGHQWMLSQRIEIVSPEEMKRRAEKLFG